MIDFITFYLSGFIPALFKCNVVFYAFCAICFFGVFALTVYLIRGKKVL